MNRDWLKNILNNSIWFFPSQFAVLSVLPSPPPPPPPPHLFISWCILMLHHHNPDRHNESGIHMKKTWLDAVFNNFLQNCFLQTNLQRNLQWLNWWRLSRLPSTNSVRILWLPSQVFWLLLEKLLLFTSSSPSSRSLLLSSFRPFISVCKNQLAWG